MIASESDRNPFLVCDSYSSQGCMPRQLPARYDVWTLTWVELDSAEAMFSLPDMYSSGPLTTSEIETVARAVVTTLETHKIRCCLVGGAACSLYGTNRRPNVRPNTYILAH
jgi:hypothetical protein